MGHACRFGRCRWRFVRPGADAGHPLVDYANAFDDITVAKVAARFHYSPSYLTAMYRRVFGVGVAEQIIEYRIDRARELLSSTASSVADIAREVGYADPKYFMRVFKRRTGLTPGQYRDAFPARLYNTV